MGLCPYGWRYLAPTSHGEPLELRLILSRDRVGKDRKLHISASVGITNEIGACAKPTDEDIERIKLTWTPYDFSVEPSEGVNPHVIHLWEK